MRQANRGSGKSRAAGPPGHDGERGADGGEDTAVGMYTLRELPSSTRRLAARLFIAIGFDLNALRDVVRNGAGDQIKEVVE